MRRNRSPLIVTTIVVSAALVGLAGCGETSSAGPAGCGAGDGATVTVEIAEFAFEPDPLAVDACDSVVWSNEDEQAHTSTGDGDQRWSTGNLAAGATSTPVRFETAGTYTYRCALHPFMTGVVEVS